MLISSSPLSTRRLGGINRRLLMLLFCITGVVSELELMERRLLLLRRAALEFPVEFSDRPEVRFKLDCKPKMRLWLIGWG
jgi:hypothetical protein